MGNIESKGEAQGRPDGPAGLGFFESDQDGEVNRQNADNVFVLVVHYDFRNEPESFREGDAEDVENLRKTFAENRRCNFRSLQSPEKGSLLKLLSDQENLLRFFSSKDLPSVLVLFFLSHGGEDNKIFTDHHQSGSHIEISTAEVFKSLKKLTDLGNCLKLVNFGPCRGDLKDPKFSSKNFYKGNENRNSCCITFSPEMHNLVIFYSTVETTKANRDEKRGSWFVEKLCHVLNSLSEDKSLIHVLTSVQRQIHETSRVFTDFSTNEPQGQTPEVKMFPQDNRFFFSRISKQTIRPSLTDSRKAKGATVKPVSEFFTWKSDAGRDLRGRRAFILFENRNEHVEEMERALTENLGFESSARNLNDLREYLKQVQEFEIDEGVGCILTCLFCEIRATEHSNEVYVLVKDYFESMKEILHNFVGSRNDRWIGKPKIFFVINQTFEPVGTTYEKFVFQVNVESEFDLTATSHSGWLVLVLNSRRKYEKLLEILGGSDLKKGKSLQELLSHVLTTESSSGDKSFLNSTLQYLLDFPDWQPTFVKPDFQLKNAADSSIREVNFDELVQQTKQSKESQIWLLSSDAGSGKTTVLQELASELRKSDVKALYISLPSIRRNFAYNEIQFLADATHYSTTEIKIWIEKKQVFVILDGFDEVRPKVRDLVLTYVKALQEKEVKCCIATRPHEGNLFANAVSVEIKPFDEAKQIEFVQLMGKKNEEFLKRFEQKDILENPLHLSFLLDRDGECNLYEICEKLIWHKVERRLLKENGYNKVAEERIKSILELHRLVAAQFLEKTAIPAEGVRTEELRRLNDFGVATYQDQKVYFSCSTFADFLAAQKYLIDLEQDGASDVPMFESSEFQQSRTFVDLFQAR
ncbi:uncharacterized protein LOC135942249 [Cloeon dipterum]|uniref:uncharacterized protein LOC135942249 n=1 Tax=Cloeon dipterum TaxID=197152 RepID=UPI00322058A9